MQERCASIEYNTVHSVGEWQTQEGDSGNGRERKQNRAEQNRSDAMLVHVTRQ